MISQNQIKVSPHGNFKISKLLDNIAICEAQEDRYNWDNATEDKPAFIVYLGCKKDEVSGYVKTLNIFYRCDWCEVRSPKHLKGFEAEIKIRGMQREDDSYAFGLDGLLKSQWAKNPDYSINLDECIDDIVGNYIEQEPEYQVIPIEKIKEILFEGINNLIDDFAINPNQYLNQDLSNRLIKLAAENQESIDYDEYNHYATFSPRY